MNWVYVNLTYDGANLKLYLDGSVVDNVAATGTLDGRGGGLTETLLIGAQDIDTPNATIPSTATSPTSLFGTARFQAMRLIP